VNPRPRRAALYAIETIAILASLNALAHSHAGLYDWAVHHRLGGWQAMSWPAEIDVFLAVGSSRCTWLTSMAGRCGSESGRGRLRLSAWPSAWPGMSGISRPRRAVR
jgi:hypothetical protein